MPAHLTTFATDPKTFRARMQACKYHDPMKTRVLFYLQRLYNQKQNGEVLTQDDMERAIGRAAADGVDDKKVTFDREAVIAATQEAGEGKNTTNLRELIDANCGRDS